MQLVSSLLVALGSIFFSNDLSLLIINSFPFRDEAWLITTFLGSGSNFAANNRLVLIKPYLLPRQKSTKC